MKHHIMLALGLLMAVIFAYQGANALLEPGFGVKEAYVVGGLVLASWLIFGGISELKAARRNLDE